MAIEEHVGVTQSDAFEQTTTGDAVTTKHLFADGGDGKEKEATVHSHHAGASSDAPPSSGIPSAMRQAAVQDGVENDQPETPLGDHVLPTKPNLEP